MTKTEDETQPETTQAGNAATVLLRQLNEALTAADRSLRRGQFTAARQAIAMCGSPMALLAALLHVDLDAP
jgi:hypothetical protein